MTVFAPPTSAARRGPTADVGRLLFIPVCVLLLGMNGVRLISAGTYATPVGVSVGLAASIVLTMVFYWLVVRAYLTRLPSRATSRSLATNTAAVVATWLPFVLPLLHRTTAAAGAVATGDGLLLFGLAWSAWAIRTLGRSISVIPQARAVVCTGPYRLVRHPLYLGEIVSTLGLALLHPSLVTFGGWGLLCFLQNYRAIREEQLLSSTMPDYPGYRGRTQRLVPGLY